MSHTIKKNLRTTFESNFYGDNIVEVIYIMMKFAVKAYWLDGPEKADLIIEIVTENEAFDPVLLREIIDFIYSAKIKKKFKKFKMFLTCKAK